MNDCDECHDQECRCYEPDSLDWWQKRAIEDPYWAKVMSAFIMLTEKYKIFYENREINEK